MAQEFFNICHNSWSWWHLTLLFDHVVVKDCGETMVKQHWNQQGCAWSMPQPQAQKYWRTSSFQVCPVYKISVVQSLLTPAKYRTLFSVL